MTKTTPNTIDNRLDEILYEFMDDLGLGSWDIDHLGAIKAKAALSQLIVEQMLALIGEDDEYRNDLLVQPDDWNKTAMHRNHLRRELREALQSTVEGEKDE